ncbi:MAG: hypothetical protein JNM83_02410 [Myxococcales bacterium]|nr:hypothetical protein [Myxococcales bacterium]
MNQPAVTESRGAHFRAIERISLVLGVLFVVVAMIGFPLLIQLSVSYGAVLSIGNARAVRLFGERLALRQSVGLLVVLFQLKLLVLGVLIFVGLKLLRLDGIGLCVGLSILPLSIVVRAIKWGMSAPVSHGDLVKHG